eukprot:scaffold39938_cov250-Skeletonema_dohrnii-CCMP3373.AAC.2
MGRKRNQGKARKAAKAKAREEAGESNNDQTTNESLCITLPNQTQRLSTVKCWHGFDKKDKICVEFVNAFRDAYGYKYEADKEDNADIPSCLIEAESATMDKYAEVWNDSAKIEIAINCLLSTGVHNIIFGCDAAAENDAMYARYLEQHIAVALKQTQALPAWHKIQEVSQGDMHTLVKFYRKRIPCSCLDEKYQEVKSITKIGFCDRPECSFLYGQLERKKTMYCSRCRITTYCSRKCQEVDWKRHSALCDQCDAVIAKFDARQKSQCTAISEAQIDLGKKV